MEMKLKKLWPIIGAMSVLLVAPTFADNYQQNAGMQQTKSGQGTYQRGTYREITPNAGPRVANGADVFITADFIWWKAVQEGTTFATSGFQNSFATDLDAPRGRVAEVGKEWSPGFKVGLGLNLNQDGWDIYAEYTWLQSNNRNSISVVNDQTNGPSFFLQPTTELVAVSGVFEAESVTKANARWHHHLNVIDLELGRNFYLSQYFTMRPFIGLKGTWQDNDYRVSFFQFDGVDLEVGPYRMRNRNDMWGIGVRGGFDIAWYMTKNWSFYGDLAWTAMWADYDDIRRKDTLTQEDPNNEDALISTVLFNTHYDSHYAVKFVGELELGVRWEMWFYDDNYHFAVQAGWEEQVWLNWNTFIQIGDIDIWSDLNFHGLNLKFRFDF
ncbi:MAG: hypothetical protein K1060chlam2_01079 [Chlamydiae bacterium]|nr:hypothetical protein [Chlamydiota bacterium]